MRRVIGALLALWPAWAAAQEVGPVFTIDSTVAVDAPLPAMAADGRFVLAWIDGSNVLVQRFDADGVRLGGTIQVNTSTTDDERHATVGMNAAGQFVVSWTGRTGSYGSRRSILARRFAADGSALGAVFAVNTYTTSLGARIDAAVALDAGGAFVVTWTDTRVDNFTGSDVRAQRFAAGGASLGAELVVNAVTTDWQNASAVSSTQDGGFVVAWETIRPNGSADVFTRRFDAAGAPLGGDVAVNQYTTGIQGYPTVAAVGNEAVVAWISEEGADGAGPGVFARRFGATGSALGAEFRVTDSPVRFVGHGCSVVPDARGGFAVGWSSGFQESFVRRYAAGGQPVGPAVRARNLNLGVGDTLLASDLSGRLAVAVGSRNASFPASLNPEGVRYEGLWTTGLAVDQQAGGTGDLNRVLDPGETVVVVPTWANAGAAAALGVAGSASAFTGPGAPANPSYAVVDGSADYGTITEGTTKSCGTSCYLLAVGVPAARPQQHIDATFREDLAPSGAEPPTQAWSVHVGGSFIDVPRTSPYYRFAESVLHFGVTGGCGASSFCPDQATTREQMAVFLLTAKLSPRYQPPRPPLGVFTDVPVTSGFAPWVEDLWNREIVEGCGPGVYCPGDPVTRAQMAVMLLRTLEGTSYVPPACTTPVFGDVPCSDPFARWINELSARGITAGCGGGLYCPAGSVSRAQMAVFITRTFGLDLYAPVGLAARPR